MTETENDILRALTELRDAVKRMPTANPKPNLLPLFERIDQLAGQLPMTADSELRHFLARKSYEKARAKLEGQTAPKGSCGR